MKKKFVVLILSLLFINTIFAQSGLDLPFTSSKSGFTDSKTMLLKGPIKLFKEDIYNAKLIKNTIVKGKLLCTVIKEFDESGRIVLESVSEDFLNMYIKFFVIYNYLDSSDYNNPLAELTECILNSSNRVVVTLVDILQDCKSTNLSYNSCKQSFCFFGIISY